MSAHVWKAGDLAVLVIEERVRCTHVRFGFHGGAACPPKGSVRRVAVISESTFDKGAKRGERCGCIKLEFDDGTRGVSPRFRPILPAEPAFTEAMRSLKPRVES